MSLDMLPPLTHNQSETLEINPVFTSIWEDNFLSWEERTAHITDSKGKIIFHQDNVMVPSFWSQTATNILAQKYFRKTGVPKETTAIYDPLIPTWLQRRIPVVDTTFGGENSLSQVVYRLVGHWTYTGWNSGYFRTENEALVFMNELIYMLYFQIAAPNSPQWFNTGLWWAYGIEGNHNNDHYAKIKATWKIKDCKDIKTEEIEKINNSYQYPQIHACFINKVEDKLIGTDGIMDLFAKEARIFKYGSGSGCNYSAIRGKGESLSGGGISSGLLSFLKIGDTVGGAIKSGGTTRRAARSVILDCDHPDLLEFINWKVKEEEKASALIKDGYSSAYEGEAYQTISGQNSNNSVCVTDSFMNAVKEDELWALMNRTAPLTKLTTANFIFNAMAEAAWKCGDPGIMFEDTINKWNTCINDEKINATNPCFEYLWFTDTACNLASINLLPFYEQKTGFDIEKFKQAVTLWTMVLDISIDMAGYPNETIAKKTFEYRTLGLGYSNLGALLMVMGLPYASDTGLQVAGDITALMTGQAYLTSAQLAERLKPFPAYELNEHSMWDVIFKHKKVLWSSKSLERNGTIFQEAIFTWEKVVNKYNKFRNAQVTVLAPTGTISLIMDCHTTGIEPDYSLVKYKELSGGGTMRLVNGATKQALINLGYSHYLNYILTYVSDNGTMKDCPMVAPKHREVFNCANEISPMGHLKMVAACQPFVSGGISKTINLPNNATVKDIENIYINAWEMGVKCVSVYRDGCKSSQPLTAKKADPSKGVTLPSELELNIEEIRYYKETKKCKRCDTENIIQTGTCGICTNCGTQIGGC